jgi:hypothetical protein
MLVVWVVTTSGFVDKYCLALKMEAIYASETLISSTSPHGVTTQKTNIDILVPVRTSNLK